MVNVILPELCTQGHAVPTKGWAKEAGPKGRARKVRKKRGRVKNTEGRCQVEAHWLRNSLKEMHNTNMYISNRHEM